MKIEEELNKFEVEIELKYKYNNCNLIYLRLSRLDTTIKDENERIQDALNKLRADFNSLLDKYSNLEKDGFKLFVEVKSAYKNSTREEFIKMYSCYIFDDCNIYDLFETSSKVEKNLYISSFDRLSRVFFYSLTFLLLAKQRGLNIYSLLEEERLFMEKNKNVHEEENSNQLMFVFQLMMFSSSASKHSEDMSNKVKKRVTKKNGVTISSKTGNKWGVKKTISDRIRNKILRFYSSGRFTAKQISEMSCIYQIVDGIKKPISINTIRKIIQENKNK